MCFHPIELRKRNDVLASSFPVPSQIFDLWISILDSQIPELQYFCVIGFPDCQTFALDF